MAGELFACCQTCPCCPGCRCCRGCNCWPELARGGRARPAAPPTFCLCWRFVCSDERNCDCCYCPHADYQPCQFCHCSCSENPNCRCCCCSCANNPNCKCCCCTPENTECQFYESRCCPNIMYLPYLRRHRTKPCLPGEGTGSTTSVITLQRDASGHAFVDQLICPLCKRLFLHPYMLPCNHCLCGRCVKQSQIQAEALENFFILTCPVCDKAHCLPFTNRIQLRINYLRARLARKYMRQYGFLRWRFDKRHTPVYCQVCAKRRRATRRCLTCQLNYCNVCLRRFHLEVADQNHVFAKVQEIWEEKNCMLHPDSMLSKYCLDDHQLICEFCKDAQHYDHETVTFPVACSKESAALFSAIAKFKKVRYVIDNDLMEVLVLKSNFKSYKETKRREIRTGFLKLWNVLYEQEKLMMEAVENLEVQKQKRLIEYTEYTSRRIAQMDSLIQYSKEALKENSNIAFLQSAHCLIQEIEEIIENIYQPSPSLREDPVKHLKVNFEELEISLRTLFPPLAKKVSSDKIGKAPYPYGSDIMIPRHISSTHAQHQLASTRSQSLASFSSLCDQSMIDDEICPRSKSSPPSNLRDRGVYAIWDASSDTSRTDRSYQSRGIYYNPELFEESSSVPGIVIIYQTLVYPTAAKIYWTCPTEDVASFEIAYYEVVDVASDNLVRTQLVGILTDIVQQNLEIRNLMPKTEYLFKVRAVNMNGPGQWSDICKVTTPDVRAKAKGRWGLLRNIQSAFQK